MEYQDEGLRHVYLVNMWAPAQSSFGIMGDGRRHTSESWASSKYALAIEADPRELAAAWQAYQREVASFASPFYNNCADAVEWLVERYAQIPRSRFTADNVSLNHLIFGLHVPSVFPVGITLPGRTMDNIKFHLQAREPGILLTTEERSRLKIGGAAMGLTYALLLSSILFVPFVLGGPISLSYVVVSLLAAHIAFNVYKHMHNKLVVDELRRESGSIDLESGPQETPVLRDTGVLGLGVFARTRSQARLADLEREAPSHVPTTLSPAWYSYITA